MAINVLEQATAWKDNLTIPMLPRSETLAGNAEELDNAMDASVAKTVSSQSIVGQICFDLGTLYFYKGNIEKAKKLFEICSSVQVKNLLF